MFTEEKWGLTSHHWMKGYQKMSRGTKISVYTVCLHEVGPCVLSGFTMLQFVLCGLCIFLNYAWKQMQMFFQIPATETKCQIAIIHQLVRWLHRGTVSLLFACLFVCGITHDEQAEFYETWSRDEAWFREEAPKCGSGFCHFLQNLKKKKKTLQKTFKLHHRQPMQNSNLSNKTESMRISLFYLNDCWQTPWKTRLFWEAPYLPQWKWTSSVTVTYSLVFLRDHSLSDTAKFWWFFNTKNIQLQDTDFLKSKLLSLVSYPKFIFWLFMVIISVDILSTLFRSFWIFSFLSMPWSPVLVILYSGFCSDCLFCLEFQFIPAFSVGVIWPKLFNSCFILIISYLMCLLLSLTSLVSLPLICSCCVSHQFSPSLIT